MKIGMLFPDYGNQFVGMGKELYDHSRLIQEYFEEAFNCLNINFVKLCFASSDAELAKIENAYVSIFLVSVATAALLKQENIIPDEVAGYGIGEVSATCVAGGLTFPDGLYFLHKYAQFYNDSITNMNVALLKIEQSAQSQFETLFSIVQANHPELSLAAIESDTEFVVSGFVESIEHCRKLFLENGANAYCLANEKGLHSALMDSAVDQLIKYLQKIDFSSLTVPLISSVDCTEVTNGDAVRDAIIKQFKGPVNLSGVLQHVLNWDTIIEIGPGTYMSKLIKQKYPEKEVYSINKLSDIEALYSSIKKI